MAVARAVVPSCSSAIVGGMWWWGFDFGQIFGGFNRKEIEAKLATLEADNGKLHARRLTQLRARNSQLESELAMTAGAQATLSKQALELMAENTQLKEELSFLQKLVSDSNKQGGLVDRSGSRSSASATTPGITACSSSAAGTRATSSKAALTLQATVQPPTAAARRRPDGRDAAGRRSRSQRRRSSSNSSIISGLKGRSGSRRAPRCGR